MDRINLEKDKKLIIETLRKLKNSKDLSNFIDDLLTEEEILDLAQRIKIGTSTSTVSKIGQVIKYGKGSFEKILGKKLRGGVGK